MEKKYLKLLKDGIIKPEALLDIQPPSYITGNRNTSRDRNSFPREFYNKITSAQEKVYIEFSTKSITCADDSSPSTSTSPLSSSSASLDIMSVSFCPNPPILEDYLSFNDADSLIKAFRAKNKESCEAEIIFPFYECVASANVGSSTLEQSIAWWNENTYSSYFNILDDGEWKKKPVLRLKKTLPPNSQVYLFGSLVHGKLDQEQEKTRATVSFTSGLNLILHESIELLLQNQLGKLSSCESPLKMMTQPRTFNVKTRKNVHGIGMLVNSRCLVAHSVIYFEQNPIAALSDWEFVKLSDSLLNIKKGDVIDCGSSGGSSVGVDGGDNEEDANITEEDCTRPQNPKAGTY